MPISHCSTWFHLVKETSFIRVKNILIFVVAAYSIQPTKPIFTSFWVDASRFTVFFSLPKNVISFSPSIYVELITSRRQPEKNAKLVCFLQHYWTCYFNISWAKILKPLWQCLVNLRTTWSFDFLYLTMSIIWVVLFDDFVLSSDPIIDCIFCYFKIQCCFDRCCFFSAISVMALYFISKVIEIFLAVIIILKS